MPYRPPFTEDEIKTRMNQVSVLMRRTQRQLSQLNADWLNLVAERIELADKLATFETYRAETGLR